MSRSNKYWDDSMYEEEVMCKGKRHSKGNKECKHTKHKCSDIQMARKKAQCERDSLSARVGGRD